MLTLQRLTVLASGLIFGIGLTISGMVNPSKIINFLDLAGAFDATLIFVMGGAVVVTAIGYYFVLKQKQPLFADRFHLPTVSDIDLRLVGGSALFGVGWGLSGFCPGPAISSLAFGHKESFVMLAAMAVGALAARFVPEE